MSVKAVPRFGGGGEKCKTCEKTVYPNERISYDNGTWHQLCFKCNSCRSTLSLTAVAMIGGVLYCKNCFKRTFLKEGRYTSFEGQGQKSLPKDVAAELTHSASMATPASEKKPTPPVSRSASVIQTGSGGSVAAGAEAAGSGGGASTRSPSTSVSSSGTSTPPSTPVTELQSAVQQKDVARCHALLAQHGAALLFEPVKSGGSTLLEWALTSYMHKSTGVKLVEWLDGKVKESNRVMRESGVASPLEGEEARQQQGGKKHVEEESKDGSAETEAASTSETSA